MLLVTHVGKHRRFYSWKKTKCSQVRGMKRTRLGLLRGSTFRGRVVSWHLSPHVAHFRPHTAMRNDMNRESIRAVCLGQVVELFLIRRTWEFSSQSRGLGICNSVWSSCTTSCRALSDTETRRKSLMSKIFIAFALLSATFLGTVCSSYPASAQAAGGSSAQPVNQSSSGIEHFSQLFAHLALSRRPSIRHRNFAIMHAAIYDAVNAIDRNPHAISGPSHGVPRAHPGCGCQSQRLIKFVSLCIQHLRPHSMPNCQQSLHKFRTATAKSKESA